MNESHVQSSACPMHADNNVRPIVSHRDELVFPKHRSAIVQYSTNATGVTELYIYYGGKEISFDEPALFAFGETLAKKASFTAGDATGWGDGYEWPRIRDLLQQLIEEGVLLHAADIDPKIDAVGDAIRPSPLPSSTCPVARSWDEFEAITQEIAGRSIEHGYLELIIPIFRVAHIALDADQRQVGEANVFPPALRLDVPTEWRTCNLPGSRYQRERPMNVTAMRVMRAHWPQMMAAVLRVREAYLRRFPEADGAWTVGHIERLTVAVLAVPTYQLMRQHHRVQSGELHPALSSLFRVTDGVRMVMHQMLFIPGADPTRPPNQVVSVDEIFDYAERNYSFHSGHGVCAGPRAMVRELLQVLLVGQGNADYESVLPEPAVQAAFDDLDDAIDYGFLGLRAHAVVFSRWPVIGRAYEQIADAVDAWPSIDTPAVTAFRETMRSHRTFLKSTYLAHEKWRASREVVYRDMYQQCGRGVRAFNNGPGLDVTLVAAWTAAHRQTQAQLQDILQCHFEFFDEMSASFAQQLSKCILDFLLREQAVLRTASTVQSTVNQVLGREQPKQALSAADINVHRLIQGFDPDHLPNLIDELEKMLGIRIEIDVNTLTVSRQDAAG